ncbi:MAG: hypothetical protein IJ915_01980 [Paludibacteraceae bacterium]|nr:hypothetical protein [Paludibacteraceae bacterium]
MNGSKLDWFAAKGTLTPQDVTPWQTFSGKGMRFEFEAYDWNGTAHVSHLSMRGLFGLMKMDTLICTPSTPKTCRFFRTTSSAPSGAKPKSVRNFPLPKPKTSQLR